MEYTLEERMDRIRALIEEDPECRAAAENVERMRIVHDVLTDRLPMEEERELWAYPMSLYLYHGRVMELLGRTLRLPDEP